MSRLRAVRLAPILMLFACDRPAPAVSDDSVRAVADSSGMDSTRLPDTPNGWEADAGPFVVLPTVDGGLLAGSLLRPDATDSTVADTTGVGALLGDGRLDLFSRAGKVAVVRMSVETSRGEDAGCSAWPVARFGVDAGVTLGPWTAAFAAGRVVAMPLDSIEGLASRDSMQLAANLTRLASRLPDDTSATFRGLPFVVLRAWRAREGDSASAGGFVVTTLARRVNQEDNPVEERLVLVIDAQGADATTWRVGWHERASGREEELVVAEPLLAYRITGASEPRLLFGRDDGVALSAAVLSRRGGVWRVLWESAIAGCN
ncbi:hypothetical protein GEMMAAP_00070 [Gemmatimonas phototrophica]|uniref:Lipoprotein n=1 Tax=Gemmatimonas phototrophica TaxID=1379270 RepID=A0A143BF93_9BACT|nr:hypothetical protein GEMMAAP_00070 [Gemmatimonas phototrophica]